MLTMLLWAGLALAGDCPWGDAEDVRASATMTTVTVDGQVFPVRGAAERMAFAETLHDCDAGAAVTPFDSWRRARRMTNVWSGLALVTGGWTLIGTAVTAGKAGQMRDLMVQAINASGDE